MRWKMECRLREILESCDMTQTELSRLTGISRQSIGAMCKERQDRVYFRPSIIEKICECLDVENIGDLFYFVEVMER